ncbi:MAG: hypothetical protein MUF18_21275 [Fimbriiglobus sp.]|nr:hypothetical protein [Fimbriiglobus sp.]
MPIKKKVLIKVRKVGKPVAAVPILPSEQARQVYRLALQAHAQEQQAVAEERAAKKK